MRREGGALEVENNSALAVENETLRVELENLRADNIRLVEDRKRILGVSGKATAKIVQLQFDKERLIKENERLAIELESAKWEAKRVSDVNDRLKYGDEENLYADEQVAALRQETSEYRVELPTDEKVMSPWSLTAKLGANLRRDAEEAAFTKRFDAQLAPVRELFVRDAKLRETSPASSPAPAPAKPAPREATGVVVRVVDLDDD